MSARAGRADMLQNLARQEQRRAGNYAGQRLFLSGHWFVPGFAGLPGDNGDPVLHGIDQRLNLRDQRVRIFCGQFHLFENAGSGGGNPDRMPFFDFGGAAGAVDALQNIDPFLHILVRHFTGTPGQAFATDIAVSRVGVARRAVTAVGMAGRMLFPCFRMCMGAGGRVLVFMPAAAAVVVTMVMVMRMMVFPCTRNDSPSPLRQPDRPAKQSS